MRAYKSNMIPGGITPTINVSQYDNDYAVTVTLFEGAEIYTPPVGATIRVEGTKPDGHGFEYACTYQGNVVTMPIYTQMTAVAGRFPIELVVYQSGLRVGSCNIIFAVEKAPLGEDTDISETVIPDIIDAAQTSAEAAQDAAETAQEAAAEVLSSQIVSSASGAVAAFSDGADDVAVKAMTATITPVQNGTGDPSPSNVRPISGRTGLTVTVQSGETQNTYPITWQTEAGAIYGGTLDVVSGVLTVDRAIITLDGSQNVSMSSNNRGYVSINDAIVIDASNQTTEKSVVCDRLKPETWAGLSYNSGNLCCSPLYGKGVAFRDDTKTTAADWTTYFQSNPTQFSYKLATPQTYQLTPTEIKTLLGGNTIYTDAGSVTVEYVADTKLYIDNKIAELQALVLEN